MPPSEVTIPFVFRESNEAAFKGLLDYYRRVFHPRRGVGRLRSRRSDGTQRELLCRYASGFDEAEESIAGGFAFGRLKVPITFRAHRPYWRDVVAQTIDFTTATSAGTWFPVQFPYYISSSTIFSQRIVDNDGDEEVWPLLTITGPASGISKFINRRSGLSWEINKSLQVGEVATVDLREPGNRTVRDVSGNTLMGVTSGLFWPLLTGSQLIAVEMAGATSQSSAQLSFERAWDGP